MRRSRHRAKRVKGYLTEDTERTQDMIESESGVAEVLFIAVFVIGTALYWASCLVTMGWRQYCG
ncbi:hypothetical protein N7519_000839 [Penicillium mononematosum]|uniref:uncharacterized protein n=1 Tax=Penicillium mononematosum TaxID=268346 RepID=UPI002548FDCB|nr:uncharacterized protein N7519_000839 [Penicillium mononematosum]KAJ6190818.1 hypothetical protein N7519_000839 [Penicillium mononematosum]